MVADYLRKLTGGSPPELAVEFCPGATGANPPEGAAPLEAAGLEGAIVGTAESGGGAVSGKACGTAPGTPGTTVGVGVGTGVALALAAGTGVGRGVGMGAICTGCWA